MNLPIPKTRSGILTAVLLALTLLWIYYTSIVSYLFNNWYVGERGIYTDNLSVNQTDPQCNGIPIEIIARVPKNTSQIIPGYIYLRVENRESRPISVSISVTREWGDVIPLPGVYVDNILPNKVFLEDLAPEEEAYMRFFLSLKSIDDLTIHLTQDDGKHYACKLICTEQHNCVSDSVSGAIKRSTMEHILLPPWSNVIIPVLAFTLVYLLEEGDENKGGIETVFLFILGLFESILFYETVKAWFIGNWSVWLWLVIFISILILPKKQISRKLLSKNHLKDKTVPPVEEIWAEVQKIQAEVQQLRTTLELLSQENKTKECPSCHSPALPESAVVCPSCGYRF